MLAINDLKQFLLGAKLAQYICMGLMMVIAVQIVYYVFDFIQIDRISHIEPIQSPIKVQSSQANSMNELNTKLFGEYTPKTFVDENIKRSNLNLRVVGILYSSQMKASKVIIRFANGQDEIYKAGDKLPGEVIVKRIRADGILIEHHGELERLILPKDKLIFQPPPKAM